MKAKRRTLNSQPAWVIRNDQVELAVTELGGHMAPVTFYRAASKPVRPYYVSPWQDQKLRIDDPCLVPLRGDFFCMPFGANAKAHRGEQHVLHGETATAKWTLEGVETGREATTLVMTMDTKVRPGRVTKRLMLREGHNCIYCRHVLEGFSGKASLGHHATLAVPEAEGSLRVAVSPWTLGMTNPDVVGDPAEAQYQSLALGAEFDSLEAVPTLWKDPAEGDCSSFPVRKGFTDLLGVFSDPSVSPAWATATMAREGWLWFSLKDPTVQPATLLWISNHGRHNAPWNGRNRCLGIEDVCGYFANGLADSVKKNPLSERGIPTAVTFSRRKPTVVSYIQGVARVPRGFDRVADVSFADGEVTFTSASGKTAKAPVDWSFLHSS